jgi:phage shock protein C
MYCTHCGIQIDEQACYCHQCGGATPNAPRRTSGKTLSRSREDVKVAGVCAGFARYFGLDVTLVRVLWVVLTIYPPGAGLLAYFICMIVMPKDPAPVHSNVSSTVPI